MKYLRNVVQLELNPGLCTGCGRCAEVCPHGVFVLKQGKASITDRDRCIECGACALNCPAHAVTVGRGVGCASAVIGSLLKGGEPECGCSGDLEKSSCC